MSETSESAISNLPIQPTPFIGRETQVRQVAELLARTDVRLLVLTGPGGAGKTRLGLHVAANAGEEFKDGVLYIPLESITRADLVCGTIAHGLGIQERSEKPVEEVLTDYLKARQVLLVLDNFEQVMAAASDVADLLATCAGLKILVTSRETLHLQGEHDFPVPSLSLPDEKTVAGGLDSSTLALQSEAVTLFVDRAAAVQPEFELHGKNVAAVVQICRRLDGLPLAIELAAARIRLLQPDEILARLDNTLSILTRGATDRPTRQQTLRGAFDWSYDLLDDREKRVFNRLSVFAGGFTLEAAEEVCRTETDPESVVLDDIASIEEKSLLKREESSDGLRFTMLETVREYAAGRLADNGEAHAVRQRHAEYYQGLAKKVDSELRGLNRMAWIKKLESEHNNFRTVLGWCFGGGNELLGIEIAGGLGIHWQESHFTESRNWLQQAIDAGTTPTSALASVLSLAGHYHCELDEWTQGMALLERSLAMSRDLGDARELIRSLRRIGSWSFFHGENEKATILLEECVATAKELGAHQTVSGGLNWLGQIAADGGDLERARELIEESLVNAEVGPNVDWPSIMRVSLGTIHKRRGDLVRATTLIEESLPSLRQTGHRYRLAIALTELGSISRKLGNLEESKALLDETIRLWSGMGIKEGFADSYRGVSWCLILYADMARSEGRMDQAVRLLGASEHIREPVNDWGERWLDWFNDILGTGRAQLEDSKFEAAWEAGHSMSLENAVSYALETAERTASPGGVGEEVITRSAETFPDGLSNREVEVAVLLVEGLTNREIGERLFISERTVANHVQSVLNKTGSGNRAEAAAYVIRNGLTT